MSLSTTGKLQARFLGSLVDFDGERWSGAPEVYLELLNQATSPPRTHTTIEANARRILESLTDDWEILAASSDTWDTELPPGSED